MLRGYDEDTNRGLDLGQPERWRQGTCKEMPNMSDETNGSENTAKLYRLEKYKAAISREVELMKFESTFEHASIKPLFLLNGGALVAYSTFLGANLKHEAVINWYVIAAAIAWAIGLILGTIATWLLYHSQWFFRRAAGRKIDVIEAEQESGTRSCDKQCEAKGLSEKGQKRRTYAKWVSAISIFVFLVGVILATLALLRFNGQWPLIT
jgi:hypothetical protein